ncbi:MAG: hypothetical protein MZW92_24770 [Comamonadaceae bacterium]|nr:hypothetical protein [Comamonadaceae bacterium]
MSIATHLLRAQFHDVGIDELDGGLDGEPVLVGLRERDPMPGQDGQ